LAPLGRRRDRQTIGTVRRAAGVVWSVSGKQGIAMVDLTQYARSLESDLTYIREKLAMLEAGTLQEGARKPDQVWVDITAPTIFLYKRMLVTYEAALMGVRTRLKGS
jgi:hypothetical protein